MYLYKYILDNKVIYVGKTTRPITSRIAEHKNKKDLPDNCDIYVAECKNESDMNILELLLIDKYRPEYNKDCNSNCFFKSRIEFDEPEFILLSEYLSDNIPVEYQKKKNGQIVSVLRDGSSHPVKYCNCHSVGNPSHNSKGQYYSICPYCSKLIRGSFHDAFSVPLYSE